MNVGRVGVAIASLCDFPGWALRNSKSNDKQSKLEQMCSLTFRPLCPLQTSNYPPKPCICSVGSLLGFVDGENLLAIAHSLWASVFLSVK
jgi:hypothetical protein